MPVSEVEKLLGSTGLAELIGRIKAAIAAAGAPPDGVTIGENDDGELEAVMDQEGGVTSYATHLADIVTADETTITKSEENVMGLKPGGIQSGFLADGSVTTDKIASSAVTSDKLADGSVETSAIAGGAVTPEKIDDLATLRGEMGLGSTLGVLPIANGGTGAATASNALANLGCTIVDQVSDLTAAQGYAISPAGVKAWFDQQSAQAISGSASNGSREGTVSFSSDMSISLSGSNSNFYVSGETLTIVQAGTYSFNVSGVSKIIGCGGSMEVGCSYSVGTAEYVVVDDSFSGRVGGSYPVQTFQGADTRDVYVNANTAVKFSCFHKHGASGSSYAQSSHTISFSIARES